MLEELFAKPYLVNIISIFHYTILMKTTSKIPAKPYKIISQQNSLKHCLHPSKMYFNLNNLFSGFNQFLTRFLNRTLPFTNHNPTKTRVEQFCIVFIPTLALVALLNILETELFQDLVVGVVEEEDINHFTGCHLWINVMQLQQENNN